MNGLILSDNLNIQDIKLSKKKKSYLKSENGKDDFDNLILNLLKTDENEEKSDFLLSKLLSTSENFEKEEKILSTFSQGELLSEKDIQKVTLEDMIKLSFLTKNGVNITDFQTDSKTLKEALNNKKFISELKNTKDIKSLMTLAEKFNIKVKNFEFFKVENALLPEDKKAVRKITSEEVFTLIDNKLSKEDKQKLITQINKKDKIQNSELKTPILEQLLSKSSNKKSIKTAHPKKEMNQLSSDNPVLEKKEQKISDKNLHNENKITKTISTEKVIEKKILVKDEIIIKESIVKKENDKITTKELKIPKTDKNIDKISVKEEKVLQKNELKNIKSENIEINEKDSIKESIVKKENDKITTKELKIPKTDKNIDKISVKEEKVLQKNELKNIKSENIEINEKDSIKESIVKKENNKITTKELKIQKDSFSQKQTIVHNDQSIKTKVTPTIKDLIQNVMKTKDNPNEKITKHTDTFSKIQTDINFKTIKQEQQPISQPLSKNDTQLQSKMSRDLSSKIEEDIPVEKNVVSTELKVTHTDREKQPVEVKKTFSTFAQEFKEKVESYKAPLMKIKMQLNPLNLGEVDVTLLNRGKNLHVNISSNSTNMAVFMQNQAEFRNSLINMGFTNLQMNFSENPKQEQNKQDNSKNNNKNNFRHDDNSEDNESIDIVMPYYI